MGVLQINLVDFRFNYHTRSEGDCCSFQRFCLSFRYPGYCDIYFTSKSET